MWRAGSVILNMVILGELTDKKVITERVQGEFFFLFYVLKKIFFCCIWKFLG